MLLQGLRACRLLSRRDASAVGSRWCPLALARSKHHAAGSRGAGDRRSRGYIAARATAAPPPPLPEAATPVSEPSTSTSSTVYSRPELYDIAFSYRDFKAEVRFLQDVYKRHGGGGAMTSVLELGCGTGRHLSGLAKAGVAKAVGLDLSPDMLAYARNGIAKQGGRAAQAVELLEQDMAEFDLPHKSFDMVMCLLGTFSHLLDTQQAISCFRNAFAHLQPGGLLLLELAHPGDLFDGTLILGENGKEVWERDTPNGDKLFVEWGGGLDNFDPVTQIIHRTVTINVLRGDDVVDSIEEILPQRQFTVRELELLAGMTGFKTAALFGEMSLEVDLEHEEAYRMVAVYRKPV